LTLKHVIYGLSRATIFKYYIFGCYSNKRINIQLLAKMFSDKVNQKHYRTLKLVISQIKSSQLQVDHSWIEF